MWLPEHSLQPLLGTSPLLSLEQLFSLTTDTQTHAHTLLCTHTQGANTHVCTYRHTHSHTGARRYTHAQSAHMHTSTHTFTHRCTQAHKVGTGTHTCTLRWAMHTSTHMHTQRRTHALTGTHTHTVNTQVRTQAHTHTFMHVALAQGPSDNLRTGCAVCPAWVAQCPFIMLPGWKEGPWEGRFF